MSLTFFISLFSFAGAQTRRVTSVREFNLYVSPYKPNAPSICVILSFPRCSALLRFHLVRFRRRSSVQQHVHSFRRVTYSLRSACNREPTREPDDFHFLGRHPRQQIALAMGLIVPLILHAATCFENGSLSFPSSDSYRPSIRSTRNASQNRRRISQRCGSTRGWRYPLAAISNSPSNAIIGRKFNQREHARLPHRHRTKMPFLVIC